MIKLGATTDWTKSTYCNNATCVEVMSPGASSINVKDSKRDDSPELELSPASWTAFTQFVRS
jgi:hypothetical protein